MKDAMERSPTDNFSRLVLFAPIIFICHFVEESPGFVNWFNSHVQRGITSGLFWRVNITALVITLLVVVLEQVSRSDVSMILVIAWLGFLMAANALFHIAGAMHDKNYMPGLGTALGFYLPYYSWLFVTAIKSRRVSLSLLFVAPLLASIPMLLHGYLIIFRGGRLF